MMIDIPVAPLSFKVESPDGAERVDVVEVEEDGYSVYCKRGRRGPMEDRYSAVVDLRDDSRQVILLLCQNSVCLLRELWKWK